MGYNSRDIDVGELLTLLPIDKEKGGVIITLIGRRITEDKSRLIYHIFHSSAVNISGLVA